MEIDARKAVQEFHDSLSQLDAELIIFFCSPEYDLEILGEEFLRLFGGVQVIGCTTAGEIGPAGYVIRSLTGVGFSSKSFQAATGFINTQAERQSPEGHTFIGGLFNQLSTRHSTIDFEKCFAFMLIDGLSQSEEKVAHSLQNELGPVPLIGGSAGDSLAFEKTHVYFNGRFHSNAAVVALVHTSYQFTVFMNQHFATSDQRMVVTEANPEKRIVYEINGLPASEEYARMVGVKPEDLNSDIFSKYPVVVRIADVDFVRSIQKVNSDGSLTFYCAIDVGVVLRTATGNDFTANLETLFHRLKAEIGEPELILACDCVLRRTEVNNRQLHDQVEKIFLDNRVVGFGSYGEQFRGIHINQTITGIAFRSSREDKDV